MTLRAFLREHQSNHGSLPSEFIDFHAGLVPEVDWSTVNPDAWRVATGEARGLELGTEGATEAIDHAIAKLRVSHDDTILVGGPPCQAYSLVERALAGLERRVRGEMSIKANSYMREDVY